MSQFDVENLGTEQTSNLIQFPYSSVPKIVDSNKEIIQPATPIYESLVEEANKLDASSKYNCTFDYTTYRDLEIRNAKTPIRAGFLFKSPFRLVNSHSTCQQCLYSFEIDTYGRGCIHNCTYCYAKAELTQHGVWNQPYPAPVDINLIRKVFYTVFETNKKSKWRSIMEQRIPIRIGSMSDSFMWMDDKYKVTKEFLKILNYYNYPYLIFTRSDLIAKEDYMSLLRKDLCAVQFSISSTNDGLNKLIEPGAPSAKRRLRALTTLSEAGFWTVVRINPVFPIYPDGYFTDPNFKWDGDVPKFDFSSFEMVKEIAQAKVPAILVGFGRFSGFAFRQIEKASGVNLRPFFRPGANSAEDTRYHFSEKEIRYYYEQFRIKCKENNVQFTTCYIGNGESYFWKDQDLWSNKKDCCNVKSKVSSFKTDARQIPFSERVKFSTNKTAVANDPSKLHISLENQNIKIVRTPTHSGGKDLELT